MLVHRDQLPLPQEYVAPRTETEGRLAEIWREVLEMDRVGVEDSYQDLGCDSLLAAIIFALIEEKFGLEIPMATLVDAPTVTLLALEVDRRLAGKAAS